MMMNRYESAWKHLLDWIDAPERGNGDDLLMVRDVRLAVKAAIDKALADERERA